MQINSEELQSLKVEKENLVETVRSLEMTN